MSSGYVYHAAAHAFDEELRRELAEMAQERAVKEAAEQEHFNAPSGGLERIAQKKTPLEEVKAILKAKKHPTTEVIRKARVGKEMKKRANAARASLAEFLESAKG